jgi:signal peptidase I
MKNYVQELMMFVLDIAQTFLVAFAFFLIIYGFIIQPHKVSGESMESTLHDQELILTNKIIYRFRKPQRGDVITFKSKNDARKDYIKRIIGLPNEKIEIGNNTVKVYNTEFPNGFYLKEPYLDENNHTEPKSFFRLDTAIKIPEGEYMVMGDNRQNSSDSRDWGTISKDNIIGLAWIVYWPLDRLGFQASYQDY